MNDLIIKHNNDELALENYVKKKISQPKNFMEIRGKSQENTLRNSLVRNKTQGNNKKFAFKPKLSLYATNNSFLTTTEKGNN